MAQVKFYRGEIGTSLPSESINGAIFVIERDKENNLGDIYVDMESGKRLHIKPDSGFKVYDNTLINKISSLGEIYIILDDNQNQTGIKVGDGKAYIGDLPIYPVISQDQIAFWNNKVNAFIGLDDPLEESFINSGIKVVPGSFINLPTEEQQETLVLTRY